MKAPSAQRRRILLGAGAAAALVGMPRFVRAGATADDSAVARLLASLRPNEGRLLGQLRIEGEFNATARRFGLHRTGPQSRDFTRKTVWSAQRRTSLFAGANHGSPHRLNDVWEFDLGLPGWRLLYAPDLPRSYAGLGDDASDVVFRDGILQTLRGGPAVIGHGWWGLTWDPKHQRLLFMNTWSTDQVAAIRRIGGDPAQRFLGPPLWAFDPAARRWAFVRTAAPAPVAPAGSLLEFVPALDGAVWHANTWQMRATWLFDAQRTAWRALATPGSDAGFQREAPRREAVAYHDPTRGLLVAHVGLRSHHFDVAARRWHRIIDASEDAQAASSPSPGAGLESQPSAPDVHDARTAAFFDPVSRHGLVVDFRFRRLWAYDPGNAAWSLLAPTGDPMPSGRRMLACLDVSRNALVISDDAAAWVYRYRAS